jgi:hypothetical protein
MLTEITEEPLYMHLVNAYLCWNISLYKYFGQLQKYTCINYYASKKNYPLYKAF